MTRQGTNTGHGHVWPRPDGAKARCGGPAICGVCALDKVEQDRLTTIAGGLEQTGDGVSESDQVWVVWANPYQGQVIGAYSSQDKGQAAAFRYSKAQQHYDGEPVLEVLPFRIDLDGELKQQESE